MKCTIDCQNDYVIVSVSGSIDSLTLEEFRKKTQPLIEQPCSILIDISETKYVNSDGLARIVELNNSAKQEDCMVVLISPTPLIRDVLQRTKLDTLMPVADSLDSAIATLTGG